MAEKDWTEKEPWTEKNYLSRRNKQRLCICLFAIVLAVLLCTVEKAEIYGKSMEPALMEGDSVLVEKLSYWVRAPKRGDMVIFRYRDGESALYPNGENRLYAKRIIGLPGETLQIIEGEVYINGELLNEPEIEETIYKPGRAELPITLGEDEYFLLGDNRNASADSRSSDIGNVHKASILGRIFLRFDGTSVKWIH